MSGLCLPAGKRWLFVTQWAVPWYHLCMESHLPPLHWKLILKGEQQSIMSNCFLSSGPHIKKIKLSVKSYPMLSISALYSTWGVFHIIISSSFFTQNSHSSHGISYHQVASQKTPYDPPTVKNREKVYFFVHSPSVLWFSIMTRGCLSQSAGSFWTSRRPQPTWKPNRSRSLLDYTCWWLSIAICPWI